MDNTARWQSAHLPFAIRRAAGSVLLCQRIGDHQEIASILADIVYGNMRAGDRFFREIDHTSGDRALRR